MYAEGVKRGGTLVTVSVADGAADNAVSILERHEPVDVDVRCSELRQSGWSRFGDDAKPAASQGAMTAAATTTATTTQQAAPGPQRATRRRTSTRIRWRCR